MKLCDWFKTKKEIDSEIRPTPVVDGQQFYDPENNKYWVYVRSTWIEQDPRYFPPHIKQMLNIEV